jgi:hypothetical protein
MYPSSTSFGDMSNYSTGKIDLTTTTNSSSTSSGSTILNKVSSVNTGMTGKITFDGARFKVKDFDDNSGNISEGATFKLLNKQMVADNSSLYNVKIEIVKDKDGGKFNGKVGYVYAASTDLDVDYTTGYVNSTSSTPSYTSPSSSSPFLDRVITSSPGVYGKITFSPNAGFKQFSHDDDTRVNEGATFELLSRTMAKDKIDLYTLKIKIIDDNGNGKFNGKIGYVYGASTTLSDNMNYDTGKIDGGATSLRSIGTSSGSSSPSYSSSSSSNSFQDRLITTNPGVYGKVTFSPNAGFKQFGHNDDTRVNEGATFELLSRTMIKDNIDLYTIKIKIIDDNGSGKFNGKVGFMYPASTTLTDYTNYTSEKIEGGPKSIRDIK